ncbi:MAG: YggT family protein [Rhodocyclaceae bacterium]|nr:YggT family protein [Rhodocyclaceae bacterium]
MTSQLILFLVNNLIALFAIALMLRFMLQWVRAPFANPLGHLLRTLTDWLARPLRKVFAGSGNDIGLLVAVWLLQVLKAWLTGVLTIPVYGPAALAVIGLFAVLKLWVEVLWVAIVAMAILSWVAPRNDIMPMLRLLCEPVLAPIRRLLPSTGGIDFSPLVALLLGQALVAIVLPTLEHNLLRTLL